MKNQIMLFLSIITILPTFAENKKIELHAEVDYKKLLNDGIYLYFTVTYEPEHFLSKPKNKETFDTMKAKIATSYEKNIVDFLREDPETMEKCARIVSNENLAALVDKEINTQITKNTFDKIRGKLLRGIVTCLKQMHAVDINDKATVDSLSRILNEYNSLEQFALESFSVSMNKTKIWQILADDKKIKTSYDTFLKSFLLLYSDTIHEKSPSTIKDIIKKHPLFLKSFDTVFPAFQYAYHQLEEFKIDFIKNIDTMIIFALLVVLLHDYFSKEPQEDRVMTLNVIKEIARIDIPAIKMALTQDPNLIIESIITKEQYIFLQNLAL